MSCLFVEPVCKGPGEVKDFALSWLKEATQFHALGEYYEVGEFVRPLKANGFEFECTTAGQTSEIKEPKWPQVLDEPVQDGSVVWTARALSLDGLKRRLVDSAWLEPTLAITVLDDSIIDEAGKQKASVKISGGVDGAVYDLINHVTFSDGIELEAILRVSIEDNRAGA